ncbi:hypothetical protein OIU34_19265 [Pararhizobium sp. BT-229]|uniref:hypothetical protein n=1 Tax=Pararhizobium sp. BT-229 TaxID=2986923 RepID=UPI0021F765F6|nr:hypothetical protein [Pararhizobium sp. BT-229]MCV9964023.1 hypothetical protein [Pararhizobium sp. BT-229]
MTPDEFYALPPISSDYWYNQYTGIAIEVLQLEGLDYDRNALERHDADQLAVHQKLHHDVDGDRGVSVYTLYFRNQPFALMFTGGRSGRDSRTPVVTNATLWSEARKYAMAVMTADVKPAEISPSDKELTEHYYGSRIARFGEDVRLVADHDVDPLSKKPVYDRKKFDETFDAVIRPLGKAYGYEEGLANPKMLAEAIKVFRSGVLGEKIELDIDLGDGNRIVAASAVEGQTFAHVADTRGKYYSWARQGVTSRMIGPASMLECCRDIAAGKRIDVDSAYVREASEAFGADPATVRDEVEDFLRNGGTSMIERIILRMPRDERVPATLTLDPEAFTVGFLLVDNPDLRRFCADGYPDPEQAQKLVDKALEIDSKIKSGEIKAPTPQP